MLFSLSQGWVGEEAQDKEQEGMKTGGLQKAGERLCLGEGKALGQLFLNSSTRPAGLEMMV